jgi:hypothetical protein
MGRGSRRRSSGWAAVALVGVAVGLACSDSRRRSYCGAYADTVERCCPQYEYEHLRAICQLDVDTGDTISAACGRATRELYQCAEDQACADVCSESTPSSCQAAQQAMVGICAQSPDPPPLP